MVEKIFKSTREKHIKNNNKAAHIAYNDNETIVSVTNKTKEYTQIKRNQNNDGTMLSRQHHEKCSGEPRVIEMLPSRIP